ncbi:MAG: hypothetical protein N2652_05685 [Kiritimatiellae bacterium]|nr:hypothetical protein [Kiritimatiellia bacterium]
MRNVWIGLAISFGSIWLLRACLRHEVLNPEPSISLTGLLWGIGSLAVLLGIGALLEHLSNR